MNNLKSTLHKHFEVFDEEFRAKFREILDLLINEGWQIKGKPPRARLDLLIYKLDHQSVINATVAASESLIYKELLREDDFHCLLEKFKTEMGKRMTNIKTYLRSLFRLFGHEMRAKFEEVVVSLIEEGWGKYSPPPPGFLDALVVTLGHDDAIRIALDQIDALLFKNALMEQDFHNVLEQFYSDMEKNLQKAINMVLVVGIRFTFARDMHTRAEFKPLCEDYHYKIAYVFHKHLL